MKGSAISSSSAKSSTTTTVEDCRSESRDSCYFLECKKDANCNCNMCLASINATLDLMPTSVQKSCFTKLSTPPGRSAAERTPISFNFSAISTPRSGYSPIVMESESESPDLKSTARLRAKGKGRKEGGFGGFVRKLLLGLILVFMVEIGFSWVISRVLKPELTRETVRSIGERSLAVEDLNARFRFLQNMLNDSLQGKISNCSNSASLWEINQDSFLLNSRCVLYKSAVEEVSIWGWPLQTAGLLTTGSSSTSFTILSGRVTEWLDGNVGFSTREENASWVQGKWGVSVVQLDPNTWVLEYRQSLLLESPRLFSAAFELLKHRVLRLLRRMNAGGLWLLFTGLENRMNDFAAKEHVKMPT